MGNGTEAIAQAQQYRESKRKTLMNNYGRSILAVILLMGDYVAIILAEIFSLGIRNTIFSEEVFDISAMQFYLLIPAAFISFICYGHLYDKKLLFWQITEKLFYSCLWGTLLTVCGLFVTQTSSQFSRLFVGLLLISSFFLFTVIRYVLGKILDAANLFQTPVLIIGAGLSADALVNEIKRDSGMRYAIIGFLEDYQPKTQFIKQYPILGGFNDIEKVVQKTGVRSALIAAPGLPQRELVDLTYRAQAVLEDVGIVPNLVAVPMGNIDLQTFFDDKIMVLHVKNNLSVSRNRVIKYIFDFVLSLAIMIMILPILILISILIRLDSEGEIIYKGTRIGKGGRSFRCYKFRTMYINGDTIIKQYFQQYPQKQKEWHIYRKLQDDPRVTRIGKILRRTSLDELPQIVNVLKGDMSLVGPRPYLPDEFLGMGESKKVILQTRPGITGYWQVNGRNNVTFKERLNMEAWYVCNWSIWIDIVLLWRTVKVVLLRKGAY
jgi:undecaprenyl-phosphate galactose phosphotransferase